jgi:agmatine/peptidylarginine deiminase
MKQKVTTTLPAEWAPQRAVQLTWPHADTDWAPWLEESARCFADIANAIAARQSLLVVCRDAGAVRPMIHSQLLKHVRFEEIDSNDTWARDHGPITVFKNGRPALLDFKFNGWGLKFAADKDNLITRQLFERGCFSPGTDYENCLNFVLEGGSIESDGAGTLLTTSECLLSPNRNGAFSKAEIEEELKRYLGVDRILWLDSGYLAGDDTDSHIDTLARFCDERTIAYVRCTDPEDEHYEALSRMEKALRALVLADGSAYQLVPLPMAQAVYDEEGQRLPATYANFLIINGAVLLPFYDSPLDAVASEALQAVFPDREIVGINCLPLIRQHGSLHCVTMQLY